MLCCFIYSQLNAAYCGPTIFSTFESPQCNRYLYLLLYSSIIHCTALWMNILQSTLALPAVIIRGKPIFALQPLSSWNVPCKLSLICISRHNTYLDDTKLCRLLQHPVSDHSFCHHKYLIPTKVDYFQITFRIVHLLCIWKSNCVAVLMSPREAFSSKTFKTIYIWTQT